MSVVGIDLGNLNTVIAVARNKGIDVICNEVSNRLTPTMICFGPKSRHLGEAAKTMETSNFSNTISNLKRFIGVKYTPETVQYEQPFVGCTLVPDEQGYIAVRINTMDGERVFTMTQILAMFLVKVKEITQAEVPLVTDVVISVPSYFRDVQRRAIIDAATIAGLNVLRLMPDITASALLYGIPKPDLPESPNSKHVCFVDIGHSSSTVGIVSFTKGRLEVKSTVSDPYLGGRDFDEALSTYLIHDFKQRYKIDISSSKRALHRLRTASERSKKILSANLVTMLNVDCILEDKDVSAEITRHLFETLTRHLVEKLDAILLQALTIASLSISDISEIEIIGGTTRIPAIKQRLVNFFQRDIVSTTLNQDEAVARGCAFQCAMISPTVKVKEFHMQDVNPFPIHITWDPSIITQDDESGGLELFPSGCVIPCTKLVTLHPKGNIQSFTIEAHYADTLERIASFECQANITSSIIKVQLKLTRNGLITMEKAHVYEESSEEEKVKKHDISITSHTSNLPTKIIMAYREEEASMEAHDKLIFDTEHQKNALEEFIYGMKEKLGDESYSNLLSKEQYAEISRELQDTEDWLYSEGYDTTKSVYVERLGKLQNMTKDMLIKYQEKQQLKMAIQQFTQTKDAILSKLDQIQSKEDQESLYQYIQSRMQWMESQNNINASIVQQEREKLVQMHESKLSQAKEPITTEVD